MVHLLIVDDEKTTRDSLREVIPWDELGVNAVRTAKNGVEALQIAREVKPDIVLTDIRMPKMDGIELARQLRSGFPDCKIIFLSGYADKEYLKSAISLQAVSYIEKPLNPAEIAAVIRETAALCRRESQRNQAMAQLQDSLAGGKPLVRQEIALALIKENPDIPGLIAKYDDLPFPPRQDGYFIVIFGALHWRPGLEAARLKQIQQGIFQKTMDGTCGDPAAMAAGFDSGANLILVMAPNREAPGAIPPSPPRDTPHLWLEILRTIAAGDFDVTFGVGPTVRGVNLISQSYRKAVAASARQFYRGSNQVFYHDDPFPGSPLEIPRTLFTTFKDHLRQDDRAAAQVLIKNLTGIVAACGDPDINRIKNIYFHLLLVIFEVALERGLIDPFHDTEQNYIWQEIEEKKVLASLSEYVLLNIQNLFSRPGETEAVNRKILEIIRFIRANFADRELTIQSIGNHVYLSPTYLCAFFKKSTGKTLNEFITENRLEKAKELLRDPRIKLYEVATGVGFRDVNYFSTLFKRHLGCTPTEYREQCRR